jgi:surface polysaccharide O-acyltransferase-like enzyme
MWQQHDLVSDWAYFVYNFTAYILGAFLSSNEYVWRLAAQLTSRAIVCGVVLAACVLLLRRYAPAFHTPGYTSGFAVYSVIFGANAWFWILATLGLAHRFLRIPSRCLDYLSEASYPFYILHLVFMLAISTILLHWPIAGIVRLVLLCGLTFALTLLAYEVAIRRCTLLRLLFGMRPRRPSEFR